MPGYHDVIIEAIGPQPVATIEKVEDLMRHIIFHSTLDWQTREQLHQGAREALELMVVAKREGIKI